MRRLRVGRLRVRRAAWLLLLPLACCSRPVADPVAATPPPAVCRIGPDGGRPVADRGIGGTGAPPVKVADRGIGGTGIIGVITGFASVCVAGEEVGLPPGVSTRIDEGPAGLDDLRAGQVVALEASGPAGALQARAIAVRHIVVGPVDAVGPGTMTVAGQMVAVGGSTGGAVAATPGQWVAVSGLRQGAGIIAATRIDPAPAGPVLVRGELVRIYGATRIGALALQLPPESLLPAGFPVAVTGRLQGGVLVADGAVRDLASESPSAYFGPLVRDFIVETEVAVVAGGYLVDRDYIRGAGFGATGTQGRAIARFTRGPDGLVATGVRSGTVPGGASGGGFTPAPVVGGPGARSGLPGGSGGGSGFPGGGSGGGFGPSGGFGPGGASDGAGRPASNAAPGRR